MGRWRSSHYNTSLKFIKEKPQKSVVDVCTKQIMTKKMKVIIFILHVILQLSLKQLALKKRPIIKVSINWLSCGFFSTNF